MAGAVCPCYFPYSDVIINTNEIKLVEAGVEIIEKPTHRPWGTANMSFYDPDRNIIYFRSFLK